MGNGSQPGGSVSLRTYFELKFAGLEEGLARVEKRLDLLTVLRDRVTVLETRQRWICRVGGAFGLVAIGVAVERLLALI